jgi:hypothetical protein
MGGEIGATSEPGRGSTFWFEVSLQVAETSEQLPRTLDGRSAPAALGPPASEQLILVADDDPINQIVAASMLEKIGYQTDIVSDGREAVAATEQATYAAVLMDCQMPGMDGYDATREIRRRENGNTRLPIIALTAYKLPGDREKCLAAGMDDYLNKPVTPTVLHEALRRHIAASPDPVLPPSR